ncbi:endonuclease/exonuclease/phosphatase family protein [Shewanella sedimentimangrovi]|uniref:Endonuclease/exonuclease/phosphatase family protein n=1 Tax=Shewanella sedimentimangrovi TaxID=2814293 RepID=A0ABX7R356_9GAMM|nr:endonuclease/exonuclease/phosphatase family protein [Shewanella sedimentimangrovi]QSX38264.1 endonuclease/exonuclease/phosphatase family protein [Shewanella sedimentimangrovi]
MRFLTAIVLLPLTQNSLAADTQTGAHTELRLVSYNIRHGVGMDNKLDLKRIAEVIAQAKPDLVALQEVDKGVERSNKLDIAAELGRLLGMEHRFASFMDLQGGEYGMAVLSRLPIRDTETHPLPEGAEPRSALEIKVSVPGLAKPLSFVGIHNDWTDESIRTEQVSALLKALAHNDNPVILAGDFNGEPSDASLEQLTRAGWHIMDKQQQKTWPSDKPEQEIDFFLTRGMQLSEIKHSVIDEQMASDHRPIYAEFKIGQ